MEKLDKVSLGDGVDIKQLLKIMEGMAQYGIASVDAYGVKLTLAPRVGEAVAKSPIVGPQIVQKPEPTPQQALQQVQMAAAEAMRLREERKLRLAAKTSPNIGMNTEALVEKVFQDTKKIPRPPTAPSDNGGNVG